MAGAAGGATGYYISGSSLLVNNVNSPILRSAVVSSISSAASVNKVVLESPKLNNS